MDAFSMRQLNSLRMICPRNWPTIFGSSLRIWASPYSARCFSPVWLPWAPLSLSLASTSFRKPMETKAALAFVSAHFRSRSRWCFSSVTNSIERRSNNWNPKEKFVRFCNGCRRTRNVWRSMQVHGRVSYLLSKNYIEPCIAGMFVQPFCIRSSLFQCFSWVSILF